MALFLPPAMPQERPADRLLRDPAPLPRRRVPAIPAPPQPWADDTRAAAAALHLVPAFVPREAEPPPAAAPSRETDGRSGGRDTWLLVAAGRAARGSRAEAVAAMLGDADLCERVRRMRAEERRSYDFIGGREAMPADHIRLLGDALGLPSHHLNRGRTSGHAARCAGPAGAAP